MKKFILGILIGAILFVPSGVMAGIVYTDDYANRFLRVSEEENSVSVFDDKDNKCYILYGDANGSQGVVQSVSISCVKR